LLETARHSLTAGYVTSLAECAFTQPTELGTAFAVKTCGAADGTFLLY
jgi:hypothetical protein